MKTDETTVDIFLNKFLAFYSRDYESKLNYKYQWNIYNSFIDNIHNKITKDLEKKNVYVAHIIHSADISSGRSRWAQSIEEHKTKAQGLDIPLMIFKDAVKNSNPFLKLNYDDVKDIQNFPNFVRFLKQCKESQDLQKLKMYNYLSSIFFNCPRDKVVSENMKMRVYYLHSGTHVTCVIIDDINKTAEFYDPSMNNDSLIDFFVPVVICNPELIDYKLVPVFDYSIQELSDYDSYLDIFCKVWTLHYVYYRLFINVSPSTYRNMFDILYVKKIKNTKMMNLSFENLDHSIKSEASKKLKNEIKLFLLRFLTKEDIDIINTIQFGGSDYYKNKYIKYKYKYLSTKNF